MKRVKQVLGILLVLIIVGSVAGFFHFKNKFLSAPPNKLVLSGVGQSFDFFWTGGKINEVYEPHIAMFVPVRIPEIDRDFYMQFDTGAPSTVFSYKQLLSINERYGSVFQIDTLDNKLWVSDVALTVGSVDLKASTIGIRGNGYEIDWSDSTSMIKIGTIGADFLENHTTIINYENEKITLMNDIPDSVDASASYKPMTFEGRKLMLSTTLNDTPTSLWFDSGSSAFELIVDEQMFSELAQPSATKETYVANSWGTGVTVHNIKSDGIFDFGSTNVPLTYVTNVEWPNKMQAFMMKAANIGGKQSGMTGNKLFLGKSLVLDVPNLQYALIE